MEILMSFINLDFKNYIKSFIARLKDEDFYIDSNNEIRASRNIKKGEIIEMKVEQFEKLSRSSL